MKTWNTSCCVWRPYCNDYFYRPGGGGLWPPCPPWSAVDFCYHDFLAFKLVPARHVHHESTQEDTQDHLGWNKPFYWSVNHSTGFISSMHQWIQLDLELHMHGISLVFQSQCALAKSLERTMLITNKSQVCQSNNGFPCICRPTFCSTIVYEGTYLNHIKVTFNQGLSHQFKIS